MILWYPRQESNLHLEFRKLLFYPLNYEGKFDYKDGKVRLKSTVDKEAETSKRDRRISLNLQRLVFFITCPKLIYRRMKTLSKGLILLMMISLVKAQSPEGIWVDQVQIIEEKGAPDLIGNEFQKTGSSHKKFKAGGDTIWSEDFANGFPGSWAIQDSSGICPWTYSLDGSWGYFNGNFGTASGDTLQSVTKANGFLICDPDSANNAVYGQPSGSNYVYLPSYFTTSVIDLTGFPAVLLQFEHLYRFNNDLDMIVAVSADSISWTNYFVQGNTPNNTQSANAETVNLNISTVAGNQSTVYIRIGWSARVYYWMIDDIRIIEAPDNDMALTMEQFYPFYKMTPVRQKTDIMFTGAISNNGGNTQANVKLNTIVTFASDTTFISSSSPISSVSGSVDTLTVQDSSYVPAMLGDYAISNYVTYDSTDFNPDDDTLVNGFMITDTVYARDNGGYVGWGLRTSNNGISQRGIMYEVWQQDTLTSMSVLITGLTPPAGQVLQFHLYDTTFAFPLTSSVFYTVQSSDLGQWITLSFSDFALPPGKYIAVVESYADSLYVHFDPEAPPPLPQTSYYLSSGNNWYYSTNYTYYVRMNTKRPLCNASLLVTTTTSTCDSSDADASVVVSGGFIPYFYLWNTSPTQTTDSVSGLSAGSYVLTVSDGLGCVYTEQVSIADSGAASLSTSFTDVSCAGEADGTASVVASGGTPPLTYTWSNSATDSAITNLSGGTYSVTVAGSDNCISTASVEVTEPSALLFNVVTSTPDMDSTGNGSITTSISGGTQGYTYAWNTSPVQTTANASNLVAGTYTGIVTDANGCQDSVTVTIALVLAIEAKEMIQELLIYPNPSTGILHIEFSGFVARKMDVRVFNIVGEQVLTETASAKVFQLDISKLKAGVYFLQADTGEGIIAHKIVRSN